MIESSNPEIDVNELMARVRREVAKTPLPRDGRGMGRRPFPPEIPKMAPPPTLALSQAVESIREGLSELLQKMRRMTQVSSSIPKMFRGFFRRQGGFNQTVMETLRALAEANEALTVKVRELGVAAEAQNCWLHELAAQRLREAAWIKVARDNSTQLTKLGTQLELQGELLRLVQVDNDRLMALRPGEHLRALQDKIDRAGEHLRNLQSERERRTEDLRIVRQMLLNLDQRQLNDALHLKGELSLQSATLQGLIDSARSRKRAAAMQASPSLVEAEAHRLDAFYLSFENRFRGSRADIKERVRFYLPYIHGASAGTPGRPIIDIGCGRGEWLELLGENGLEAMGLDLNHAMVGECNARDLPVTQGDAVAYLRSLPDNSQGAVTGFHIIEHLPLETLMDLFAEARRVLRPGGLAIFESPNCKNLVVGACNFNVDPTHRNPVFPETAEFMLGAHGFEKIQIEYLSPVDTTPISGSDEVAPALRALLYGPQDFAVIGRKPMSP